MLAGGAVFFGGIALAIIYSGTRSVAGVFAGGMMGAFSGALIGRGDGLVIGALCGVLGGTLLGLATRHRR
jgi:outer membrane lipoprotein SlyB